MFSQFEKKENKKLHRKHTKFFVFCKQPEGNKNATDLLLHQSLTLSGQNYM